jgi:hypothetical protein
MSTVALAGIVTLLEWTKRPSAPGDLHYEVQRVMSIALLVFTLLTTGFVVR